MNPGDEKRMKIRKSELKDLERILEIYVHARDFMARHGNPKQWGPTCWPPEDLIRQDIAEGNSYVCETGAGRIVGTFFFVQGGGYRTDLPGDHGRRLAGRQSLRRRAPDRFGRK